MPCFVRCLALASVFITLLTPVGARAARSQGGAPPADTAPPLVELTGARRPQIAGLEHYRCFDTPYGWLFATDTAAVEPVVAGLRQAAHDFQHYFQTPVERGALILSDGTEAAGEQPTLMHRLKAAGARWVLPWPDYAAPKVVAALTQQVGSAVGSAQAAQGIVQNVIAKAPETMRHELGHLWLLSTFWPTFEMQPAKEYGGPGADWLDETAAVLLEGPQLTAQRRAAFWQAYRAGRDPERVRPLATFVTMTHPDFVPNRPASDGVSVQVVSGGGRGSLEFYGECRVFADFLWAKAQDSTVFRSIAQNEAHGAHMATWLREHGSQYHLPTTVDAIETEWQKWLAEQADKVNDTP